MLIVLQLLLSSGPRALVRSCFFAVDANIKRYVPFTEAGADQSFRGFPDGVKVENSFVTLPDLPGIGFEGKADLYREMKAMAS